MKHHRRFALLALMCISAVTVASEGSATPVDVYREIFPRVTTQGTTQLTQEQQLQLQGWYGGHTGDNFQQAPTGGEGAIGGGAPFGPEQTAINSNPIFNGTMTTSYGFFSEVATSNAFLYTTEFQISSDALKTVKWDSRNNRNSTSTFSPTAPGSNPLWYGQGTINGEDTHVALRIDDGMSKVWYISEAGFLHQGNNQTWSTNTVDIEPQNWVRFGNPGTGLTLPGESSGTIPFTAVADLPSGTIDAFGIYIARNGGTTRIDNFTLVAHVPVPGTLALLGLGLAGLSVLRRRQSA